MKNNQLEVTLHQCLVKSKLSALGIDKVQEEAHEESLRISTTYGTGMVQRTRMDHFINEDGTKFSIDTMIVKLDSGAILFTPKEELGRDYFHTQEETNTKRISHEYLEKYIPPLKAQCIASHCIQQQISHLIKSLIAFVEEDDVSLLVAALEKSRTIAFEAKNDEDLSHAFQELIFIEWGDGVEEVEAAFASTGSMSYRGKSELFFLTQEANVNKSLVLLLSFLYCNNSFQSDWNTFEFAEEVLIERMIDILEKFLTSEKNDSISLDLNVWRSGVENIRQIGLYCTTFAGVVVVILNTILVFSEDQFSRHRKKLFPILCSLIGVQSEEIRQLVRSILMHHLAKMVGI